MQSQELVELLRVYSSPVLQLGPSLIGTLVALGVVAIWLIRDFYYAFRYRESCISPMGEEVHTPSMLIVMIHGTWGRRTRFIQEKNRLHEKLQSMLTDRAPQFCRMEWSGANLIFARRSATEALVADLKARIARTPRLRSVVLIGHSHGGNLAYDAATQLIAAGSCRSRSAAATDPRPEISVAALATPFLIEQINKVPLTQALVTLLVLATTFVMVVPEARLYVGEGLLTLGIMAGASNWHWIVIALLPAAAAQYLIRTISRRHPIAGPPPDSAPSVLAIISPNDEAMAALGFFKLLESVFRGAMRAMRRLMLDKLIKVALIMAAAVVLVALYYMISDLGFSPDVARACALFAGMIGGAVAVWVAVVIAMRVLFRFVSALILLPVLPDAIRSCLSTEVHVAPVPPGISQTLAISPSRDPVIFHSDFAESNYFDALVRWIERRQRRDSQDTSSLSITLTRAAGRLAPGQGNAKSKKRSRRAK